MSHTSNKKPIFIIILLVVGAGLAYYAWPMVHGDIEYSNDQGATIEDTTEPKTPLETPVVSNDAPVSGNIAAVSHIATPERVKAIYASSWVAGSAKYRDPLIKMIDETDLNSIVIDVKDSTGRIGFAVSDPELQKMGTTERRIPDIRALTNMLHQHNVYIIGRVAVFQDPYLTKLKPEWAITKKSDGAVWKDRKGLSFLDPANKEVHKYIVAIAHDAYAQGFDEINFDYIRYPSDGNIQDINYHLAPGATRSDNLEAFFIYLNKEVKKDVNIPTSADVFGLTTEAGDDMGIGQVWEKIFPHFDYIAPMIYPSHYPAGSSGFKNPADHPYEIIAQSMDGALRKTKAINGDPGKIRPWLQDFNLGAIYTKDMVEAQIKALSDKGIHSWLMWDPKNKYTPEAFGTGDRS